VIGIEREDLTLNLAKYDITLPATE